MHPHLCQRESATSSGVSYPQIWQQTGTYKDKISCCPAYNGQPSRELRSYFFENHGIEDIITRHRYARLAGFFVTSRQRDA